MNVMKTFLSIAVVMAVAVTLTIMTTAKFGEEEIVATTNDNFKMSSKDESFSEEKQSAIPIKRVSRFLAQMDPRPNYQCNKNHDVCLMPGSPGPTCCNNKCFDLMTDNKHCGACKIKCKHTESCCNGKCVNLAFDKRHCGKCNKKCMQGGYCVYAMCDYA